MIFAASASSLTPALALVFGLGLCAGGVYVLGFTILQTNVEDHLRGRIFATLYTLIRLCLLLAFTLAPVLAKVLGSFTDEVPGTRLALWLGGTIILAAGALSLLSLRTRVTHPS
jgi:MFS family permease